MDSRLTAQLNHQRDRVIVSIGWWPTTACTSLTLEEARVGLDALVLAMRALEEREEERLREAQG